MEERCEWGPSFYCCIGHPVVEFLGETVEMCCVEGEKSKFERTRETRRVRMSFRVQGS